MRVSLPIVLCLSLTACSSPEVSGQVGPYDSGGPLMAEQAAYDVLGYALELSVNPADSTIAGKVTVNARVGSPLEWLVLDLDPVLEVVGTAVNDGSDFVEAPLERVGGKLWIDLPRTYQPHEIITASVEYGGKPRVAENAPWDGGFSWDTTATGAPWIATTCQGEGADLWWPVKDHVSDEPDWMSIRVTVPDPLVVASNGKLVQIEPVNDGQTTYHWYVSDPINTYNVALNIAPYKTIEGELTSVAGDTFPVQFFVLEEDYDKGVAFFPEILEHLRWFESRFGPYPFRGDKYGVAQTPHLGMEHQSIIAYGANFDRSAYAVSQDFGFDQLHHHELAHEWWGNLVTNADWKDAWLHEGFGTYTQPLYAEELGGEESYLEYMQAIRGWMQNLLPVAPHEIGSVNEMFERPHDIYMKGAWVLHTLRHVIGAEALATAMRRMAYPDPESESVPGCRCRFASTDDFIRIAEEASGQELNWFFDVYVRQPQLPELEVARDASTVTLSWKVPEELPFPMPLPVSVDGEFQTVEFSEGAVELHVDESAEIVVDPQGWILMKPVAGL